MRRLIATIMALPSIASRRFSQCSTMSRGDEVEPLLGADDRLEPGPA